MNYNLHISEKADKNLRDAAIWYEGQNEGLGIRLVDVIKRKIEIIQHFPERYPVRTHNFREAAVKTFPYLIVYKIYKRKSEELVYSIIHTKRNPKIRYRKS